MLQQVQICSKAYLKGFVQCLCDIEVVASIPAKTILTESRTLEEYRCDYTSGYQDCFCKFIQQVETDDLERFGKFILYILWNWAVVEHPLDVLAPLYRDVKEDL